MKFTGKLLTGLALIAALTAMPAAASAAHCVDPTGTSPGFSYFGTDHVKEAAHANEGVGRPHAGTPGASNCRATSGSPSDRAPGQ